jgi:hypothetical protein
MTVGHAADQLRFSRPAAPFAQVANSYFPLFRPPKGSVSLFALPRASILVERIPRLNTLETSGADKFPAARIVGADAIEDLLGLLTTIACFDANPFDGQLNHPFG